MKNIFMIQTNRSTKTTTEEYNSFVLRRLTKKQMDKINAMSQKYNMQRKKSDLPQWLYLMNRIFFTALLTSFIFLIVSLIMDARKGMEEFFIANLWIIILFLISALGYIILKVTCHFFRKRKKIALAKQSAEDIFKGILNTSRDFLGVPKTARNLEIFMEQRVVKNENVLEKKGKLFSNVILSVFIEKDMLCFADLYLVVAIPLSLIDKMEKVDEPYNFKFWHRKERPSLYADLGIHPVSRPVRCYQGAYYYRMIIRKQEQEYAVFFPAYDKSEWEELFSEEKEVKQ